MEYFRNLFCSNDPSAPTELLQGMLPRVTEAMNRNLIKPVTYAEIRVGFFSIKGGRSPGADGMTGNFFP